MGVLLRCRPRYLAINRKSISLIDLPCEEALWRVMSFNGLIIELFEQHEHNGTEADCVREPLIALLSTTLVLSPYVHSFEMMSGECRKTNLCTM